MSSTNQPVEFIPIREVIRMTSLSKPVVYRLIRDGGFPKQIPLSPRRVAWVRADVEAWQREKETAARAAA